MKFARPGTVGLHDINVQALIEHIMALMQFEAEGRQLGLTIRWERICLQCWATRPKSARSWSTSS